MSHILAGDALPKSPLALSLLFGLALKRRQEIQRGKKLGINIL